MCGRTGYRTWDLWLLSCTCHAARRPIMGIPLKERICSLWEQILSFKDIPYEKGDKTFRPDFVRVISHEDFRLTIGLKVNGYNLLGRNSVIPFAFVLNEGTLSIETICS